MQTAGADITLIEIVEDLQTERDDLLEALGEMVDAHSMKNIGVGASMRRIKAIERARILLKKAKS